MWYSLKAYLRDKEDAIQLRTERDTAVTQFNQQQTTLNWFMHRLTQVEQERSRLIHQYTGVKIEAPVYERDEHIPSGVENPLNALPTFNDVGDKEAQRLGIDWDAEGTVLYGVTK